MDPECISLDTVAVIAAGDQANDSTGRTESRAVACSAEFNRFVELIEMEIHEDCITSLELLLEHHRNEICIGKTASEENVFHLVAKKSKYVPITLLNSVAWVISGTRKVPIIT